MINGIGNVADVGRTSNLRRHPQAQQQNRLHQYAEHRFTAGADSGERATGIQTGDRKEEAGNGKQVNQRDQITQLR
ncbi:hypothetical protein EHSB41UT_04816 [Parendozoicomonas haliclonae]|uniref:Uncharacterized protein n=1 Tax=Parendozoicomonas haliclonae TaxID=1960125 RepID=A0A1X7ASE5_9GAMM|nr:hypothetical protein EHSB41UT_04816 [Parendozoicomonas haliclonae]